MKMKHSKKLKKLSIAIVTIASIALFWTINSQAAMTLKFNHTFYPNDPVHIATKQFAQEVEKKTNGEIKIQVYHTGQLGNVLNTYQGLTLGTIDFTILSASLIGYLKGHEEFFIGQLPYLFNSNADARRIYRSEIFDPLYDKLVKEKGIRKLAIAGSKHPRCINTTKGPIFSTEDCKGLKIRVMPVPVSIKAFQAFGFQTTPVNWTELYMALKQGVVEGQDNGPDLTVSAKFYEVAKYYAMTNHVNNALVWLVSEKAWKKVPEKYHAIMKEAALKAGKKLTAEAEKQTQKDIETLLKAGVKITIPNRASFREAVKDVWKEFDGKLWPSGMYEKIRAMQE